MRIRWRSHLPHRPTPARAEQPEPAEPGKIYELTISLANTSYVFNKGHKVRVSVTSSNHPRFSINPNTGDSLVKSEEGRQIVAENTLHFGSLAHPSALHLPVVELSDLPKLPGLVGWQADAARGVAELARRITTTAATGQS